MMNSKKELIARWGHIPVMLTCPRSIWIEGQAEPVLVKEEKDWTLTPAGEKYLATEMQGADEDLPGVHAIVLGPLQLATVMPYNKRDSASWLAVLLEWIFNARHQTNPAQA